MAMLRLPANLSEGPGEWHVGPLGGPLSLVGRSGLENPLIYLAECTLETVGLIVVSLVRSRSLESSDTFSEGPQSKTDVVDLAAFSQII